MNTYHPHPLNTLSIILCKPGHLHFSDISIKRQCSMLLSSKGSNISLCDIWISLASVHKYFLIPVNSISNPIVKSSVQWNMLSQNPSSPSPSSQQEQFVLEFLNLILMFESMGGDTDCITHRSSSVGAVQKVKMIFSSPKERGYALTCAVAYICQLHNLS